MITHLCPFSKSKLNLYEAWSLTASILLHRLVLSIELGTLQTGIGKVDPARKFKCTTAARVMVIISLEMTRLNPDRNIFSINAELTLTFLLDRGLVHYHHRISIHLKNQFCNITKDRQRLRVVNLTNFREISHFFGWKP